MLLVHEIVHFCSLSEVDSNEDKQRMREFAKAIATAGKQDKPACEEIWLPFHVWIAAFQVRVFGLLSYQRALRSVGKAYAFAADVTGHISFGVLMSHQCVVLQVADELRALKRPFSIAVDYDRLVRWVPHLYFSLLLCLPYTGRSGSVSLSPITLGGASPKSPGKRMTSSSSKLAKSTTPRRVSWCAFLFLLLLCAV